MIEQSDVDRTVDDGLHDGDGSFLMHGAWLVDCYAETVCVHESPELLEHLLAHANDARLCIEKRGLEGRHLGNVPRALIHVPLINLTLSLAGAGTGRWRR